MTSLNLDIRTMLSAIAVGNLVILVLVAAYRDRATRPELFRIFLGGKALQILGWSLLTLRGHVPDLVSVQLGNSLLIAGFALECLALTLVNRASRPWVLVYAALVCAGVPLFWLLGRTPCARVVVASLVAAAVYGAASAGLALPAAGSRLRGALALLCGLHGGILAFRGWSAFAAPGGFSLLTPNPVQTLAFLSIFTSMLVCGLGFLLLVLEQDDRRLQESQAKFAKVFQSAPYATVLSRLADGRVLDVNERFEEIMGYRLADIAGRTTPDLPLFADPGHRQVIVDALLAAGRVRGLEISFLRRGGQPVTGLFSAELLEIDGQKAILSSIADISDRKRMELERDRMIRELQQALSEVKTLGGLLPICASCKKIRDDQGYWNQIEGYLREHTGADFTHGLCPECVRLYFPDLKAEGRAEE